MSAVLDEVKDRLRLSFCGLDFSSPLVLLSGCVGFGEEYTRVAGFSNRDAGANDLLAEEKQRAFDYYEALTVRDSSLSACTQAVMAAEVGHLDLAYDYFGEAALMDLGDLEHNVRDGVHMASLAGAWLAAVAGFGGMRDHDGTLSFAPKLPDALRRLTFRLVFRSRRFKVDVVHGEATYTLLEGDPLELGHHGETLTISMEAPQTLPIPPQPRRRRPKQPPGREPARRRPRQGP